YNRTGPAFGGFSLPLIWVQFPPNGSGSCNRLLAVGVGRGNLRCGGLGIFGFGANPPTPGLGGIPFNKPQFLMSGAWWAATFPGLAIVLAVLGLNLLGDGLRDALDPRLRM
ncbi:MAG: ABC transporter permease, partial [Atribacterota bacterium]